MLPFKIVNHAYDVYTPLKLYTVGRQAQRPIFRPTGISAQQLYVCAQGRGTFFIKHNPPVILSAGQGLFLPANTVHEYEPLPEQQWELAFVSFYAELLFIQGFGLVENVPMQLKSLQPLYDIFDRLWNQPHHSIHHSLVSSGLIYSLLLEFNKQCDRLIVKNKSQGNEPETIITNLSTFIHDHYFQDMKVSDVARIFGYSLQHLNRLFKERYGLTVHQYWIHIQLDQACSMLIDYPHLTLAEVAGKIGMEAGYFMKAFKKNKGISAKQYSKGKLKLRS
jgi:AraC family transcriptional regulator